MFKEIHITFSEEQFGPATKDYNKVLGLEWDIKIIKLFSNLNVLYVWQSP